MLAKVLRLPRIRLARLLALAGLGAIGCRPPGLLPPTGGEWASPAAPDSFEITFETSKGPFIVRAHRDWSPAGVDRLHDLIRRRVYDDLRVYRMMPGFVAQFGLGASPEASAAWQRLGIPDEPVVRENRRSRVSFARGGPRTRSLQIFINLGNNSPRLDTLTAGGVVGYPPIGEVTAGMEAVDLFTAEYGAAPAQRQDSIRALGNAWLDRTYPNLDRIFRARITREWR